MQQPREACHPPRFPELFFLDVPVNGLLFHLWKRFQSFLSASLEKRRLRLSDIVRNIFDFLRFLSEQKTIPDTSLKVAAIIIQMSSVSLHHHFTGLFIFHPGFISNDFPGTSRHIRTNIRLAFRGSRGGIFHRSLRPEQLNRFSNRDHTEIVFLCKLGISLGQTVIQAILIEPPTGLAPLMRLSSLR